MKLTATLHQETESTGAVRVEDTFDTDAADLWDACTRPERLARWIADVEGDLRVGGAFRATFTSGWEGSGRVEVCEPPHRLAVLNRAVDSEEAHRLEATLVPDGERCRLIVEEHGLPLGELPSYGAGWQAHLEDLTAILTGRDRCDLGSRWRELIGTYQQASVQ